MLLKDKGHKFEVEYFTQTHGRVYMDGMKLEQVTDIQIEESATKFAKVIITFIPKEVRVYMNEGGKDEKPAP